MACNPLSGLGIATREFHSTNAVLGSRLARFGWYIDLFRNSQCLAGETSQRVAQFPMTQSIKGNDNPMKWRAPNESGQIRRGLFLR
jgi:hypothetical protein